MSTSPYDAVPGESLVRSEVTSPLSQLTRSGPLTAIVPRWGARMRSAPCSAAFRASGETMTTECGRQAETSSLSGRYDDHVDAAVFLHVCGRVGLCNRDR